MIIDCGIIQLVVIIYIRSYIYNSISTLNHEWFMPLRFVHAFPKVSTDTEWVIADIATYQSTLVYVATIPYISYSQLVAS